MFRSGSGVRSVVIGDFFMSLGETSISVLEFFLGLRFSSVMEVRFLDFF